MAVSVTLEGDGKAPENRVPVGISSCLLGEAVRYDGGHKRDAYIQDVLGHCLQFVPVCPELAVGLGVPREPIQLVAEEGGPVRVRGVLDPKRDVTEALRAYGRRMASEPDGIHGYILKAGSPSCGMAEVPVHDEEGTPWSQAAGAFADSLMAEWPGLPVEEEGRLTDPALCESFLDRVLVHKRFHREVGGAPTPRSLVDFHRTHKLLIMAHDSSAVPRLGRLVAQAGQRCEQDLAADYLQGVMAALARPATRGTHANALYHLMGYLKEELDGGERAGLVTAIESFRTGHAPLASPIARLNQLFRSHPNRYATQQWYLEPYPGQLDLRERL